MIGGRELKYLAGRCASERIVEIPCALDFIQRYSRPDQRMLEVGNSLGSLCECERDIVDKYESSAKVINEDILTFDAGSGYDLIVSVSTLEHVGFDEARHESAFEKAMRKLADQDLRVGGHMLITVPLGYNPEVDSVVLRDYRSSPHLTLLRRVSANNLWKECSPIEILRSGGLPQYGSEFAGASVVAILQVHR